MAISGLTDAVVLPNIAVWITLLTAWAFDRLRGDSTDDYSLTYRIAALVGFVEDERLGNAPEGAREARPVTICHANCGMGSPPQTAPDR